MNNITQEMKEVIQINSTENSTSTSLVNTIDPFDKIKSICESISPEIKKAQEHLKAISEGKIRVFIHEKEKQAIVEPYPQSRFWYLSDLIHEKIKSLFLKTSVTCVDSSNVIYYKKVFFNLYKVYCIDTLKEISGHVKIADKPSIDDCQKIIDLNLIPTVSDFFKQLEFLIPKDWETTTREFKELKSSLISDLEVLRNQITTSNPTNITKNMQTAVEFNKRGTELSKKIVKKMDLTDSKDFYKKEVKFIGDIFNDFDLINGFEDEQFSLWNNHHPDDLDMMFSGLDIVRFIPKQIGVFKGSFVNSLSLSVGSWQEDFKKTNSVEDWKNHMLDCADFIRQVNSRKSRKDIHFIQEQAEKSFKDLCEKFADFIHNARNVKQLKEYMSSFSEFFNSLLINFKDDLELSLVKDNTAIIFSEICNKFKQSVKASATFPEAANRIKEFAEFFKESNPNPKVFDIEMIEKTKNNFIKLNELCKRIFDFKYHEKMKFINENFQKSLINKENVNKSKEIDVNKERFVKLIDYLNIYLNERIDFIVELNKIKNGTSGIDGFKMEECLFFNDIIKDKIRVVSKEDDLMKEILKRECRFWTEIPGLNIVKSDLVDNFVDELFKFDYKKGDVSKQVQSLLQLFPSSLVQFIENCKTVDQLKLVLKTIEKYSFNDRLKEKIIDTKYLLDLHQKLSSVDEVSLSLIKINDVIIKIKKIDLEKDNLGIVLSDYLREYNEIYNKILTFEKLKENILCVEPIVIDLWKNLNELNLEFKKEKARTLLPWIKNISTDRSRDKISFHIQSSIPLYKICRSIVGSEQWEKEELTSSIRESKDLVLNTITSTVKHFIETYTQNIKKSVKVEFAKDQLSWIREQIILSGIDELLELKDEYRL